MKDTLIQLYHQPGRRGMKSKKGCSVDLRRDQDSDPDFRPRKRSELLRSDRHRCQSNSVVARFLLAQVGKSWDCVYSGICRLSKGNQLLQKEFFDKLDGLVEQNVRLVDGVPYDSTGLKIVGRFSPVWVHPVTGILMATPVRPRRRYTPRKRFRQVVIDECRRMVLIDELWFEVTFAPLPAEDAEVARDILLNELTSSKRVGFITREWGANIYAVSKRQASKREIKRFVSSSDS